MRLFLNAVFHLKLPFSEICPKVIEILEKNNWDQEHTLFHFQDVNDAKSESQTVHAKLCKAFPQFAPYWKIDYERSQKIQKHPAEPHRVGYFTNFPGLHQGKVVYLSDDIQVDTQMVMKVCEKIPRPYSFFWGGVVLDRMNWYGNAGTSMYDWRYLDTDFEPGTIRDVLWNVELYQGDSIILAKRYDLKPDLLLRIEITDEHGRKEADEIVEKFAHCFGQPDKKFIYPVPEFDEKEQYIQRIQKIRHLYTSWKQGIQEDLVQFENATKAKIIENIKNGFYGKRGIPARKTLQKKFLEKNSFARHDRCRWDDHGWCRPLPHNIWLYIDIISSKDTIALHFDCYSMAFDLHDYVLSGEFQEESGDVSGALAFEKYGYFLTRFIDEVVPRLVELYPADDRDFYQESIENRYFPDCYRIVSPK